MTEPNKALELVPTPQLQAALPPEPQPSQEMVTLTDIATDPQKRTQLFCQNLLLGETREAARKEAAVDLERILGNTQIVAIYGNDALDGVNRLNDRMLNERHPVEVPELRDLMRNLSRQMRGLGNKYDPSDPHVREKYEKARDNIFVKLRWAKSFLEEFLEVFGKLVSR